MDDVFSLSPKDYSLIPLTLSDKSLFEKALASLKKPLSDYSFANIYLWKDSSHLTWAKIHNHLCVFTNGIELTLFLPPLPLPESTEEDFKKCLTACFEIMDKYHLSNCIDTSMSKIRYTSEEMLNNIIPDRTSENVKPEFSFENFSGDYIYDKQEMINLPGSLFKRKRKAKQKFMRTYPNHREENLKESHIPDCLTLLNLWKEHAEITKKNQLTYEGDPYPTSDLRSMEIDACQQALYNYSALNLRGMVLYVGDKLVGFTLGEKIGESQASILFEKTHPEYEGAAQFIFSEFCKLFWEDCHEINAGDDWFIPTLRTAKESYHPKRRLNKYTLIRNPEEAYIRKARPDDLNRLIEIEHRSFAPGIALTERQIRMLISNPKVTTIVAYSTEGVIGWASSFTRQSQTNLSGRVYTLAVDPEHRSKGIGKKLLNFLIRRFEVLNYSKVYLEVEDNNPAIKIYHSFGFKKHQDLPNYYGLGKHGKRMCLEINKNNKKTTSMYID